MRKESAALIKFKHPSILGVVEPLLENSSTMAFATEPIQNSLTSWIESGGLSKLEIKLMITEICNVIRFLHDDAHVISATLTPDNIFITTTGHIKLSGLAFSINDPPISGAELKLSANCANALPNLTVTD